LSDIPPSDEQPTEPQPNGPQPEPRQLTRSSDDRMIGGVAGGLGRHLGIDPLAIRITFVVLSFAGGLGLLAYLLGLAFIPSDDPSAPPARWGVAKTVGAGLLTVAALAVVLPHWFWGPAVPILAAAGVVVYVLLRVVRDEGAPHFNKAAARIGLGILLLALAAGGFVAAAAGAAVGGGVAVAGLVIACGVGLVAGAFRGGARWLIVPALVFALPLGVVAASDLDVRGTWGDRTFRPATTADVAHGYKMGAGSMKVDLREVLLPPGQTDLRLKLGLGEIQVLVPDDLCVTTDAHIGMGAMDSGDGEQGGVDVDIRDHPLVDPGIKELHIKADIGVGGLEIGDRFFNRHGRNWRGHHFDEVRTGTNRAACRGAS
jgi:phage shock protein PspC (stress-responsive transcriptional regulator)